MLPHPRTLLIDSDVTADRLRPPSPASEPWPLRPRSVSLSRTKSGHAQTLHVTALRLDAPGRALVPLAAREPAERDQPDQRDDDADPDAPHDRENDAQDQRIPTTPIPALLPDRCADMKSPSLGLRRARIPGCCRLETRHSQACVTRPADPAGRVERRKWSDRGLHQVAQRYGGRS